LLGSGRRGSEPRGVAPVVHSVTAGMPMRALLALILMAGCAGAVAPKRAHTRELRHKVLGNGAFVGAGASAALGTARNHPREWGRGPAGAAKRFGSSFGQHALKEGIQFGVGSALHENLHYQRSNKHGVLPRMAYAVKRTFIVPKTNRPGKKTPAVGRVAGNMGAGVMSRAWQPASTAGLGAGLATGGIGLGADVGANMAREFWPRKHKRHVRRR
jgi:hypothetical protein